ncbi:hypothetical protein EQK26_11920 [Lactiplantibacillus plantarum]|nr:hypothetical protein [Lactiplantibacillus plantarum]QAS27685.1 hypothetical protein EQK26_11920 [Lactiplantibacillus plantarum]RWZ43674.1 hypothetical protein EQG58_03565 [Lactiplantibacillus plantarum]
MKSLSKNYSTVAVPKRKANYYWLFTNNVQYWSCYSAILTENSVAVSHYFMDIEQYLATF